MLWKFAKPLLFQLDPEKAHHLTLYFLKKIPRLAGSASTGSQDAVQLGGLRFKNPIGLAAGLDKNAEALMAWQNLGFGFAEVGTVTALPQPGNPKPRLFRLPESQALFNRMGFNNDGAKAIAHRIASQRRTHNIRIPIGINIGKSAVVPVEDAASDYCASFEIVADVADYITINVSSPNTKNLRNLQNARALASILDAVVARNERRSSRLPLFVKIAPDLEKEQAVLTCQSAIDCGVMGIIISNTTTKTDGIPNAPQGGGGLSGAPLFASSTELLSHLRKAFGQKAILVGSGGVMSASDARSKIEHGADLVQVYSGLIYNGPELIRDCVRACTMSRIP